MIKNINLDYCSKEELRNRIKQQIGFLRSKKFIGNIWIKLDNKYENEPTIHFCTFNDDCPIFGVIEIDWRCNTYLVTNQVDDDNPHYCELDEFVDDLYTFICEYYYRQVEDDIKCNNN